MRATPPPWAPPHPPPPTRNPCAIYNTWARFGGCKIESILGFARCKGWHARGVAFVACRNATVSHLRSAALGLAALQCATCRLQPCSLQPYSLQPATLQPCSLQPCNPQLATLHALALQRAPCHATLQPAAVQPATLFAPLHTARVGGIGRRPLNKMAA